MQHNETCISCGGKLSYQEIPTVQSTDMSRWEHNTGNNYSHWSYGCHATNKTVACFNAIKADKQSAYNSYQEEIKNVASVDDSLKKELFKILRFSANPLDSLYHFIKTLPKISDAEIICIVGSSRFADLAAVIGWEFEKLGKIVLGMNYLPQWYVDQKKLEAPDHLAEQEGVAEILDSLHLKKIDLSDRIYVVNPKGYIGARTKIEIAYAEMKGKPISYHDNSIVSQKIKPELI